MSQQESQPEKEKKAAELQEQRRLMLKRVLTPGALERLKRIELVKPERSRKIEDYFLTNGMRLAGGAQITEEQLINVLEQIPDTNIVTKIQIKHKVDDDDWDW
ncbi:double-stranded DNA-binding domain protein [Gregarina niphandrodes]|uniref:Double-stranded DNA-binding domain protein n=1 Tax=Gregarina niphandrodes TaxID=110365 RepID=A0A023BCH0_GRENI|nr:double-stranded DNA-binding domain protein [Gregarina niphandrodes]EZG83729.1 double-stranded DNA-binding domain protein [Gregarina niphandrodes]|eukprot:XP_011128917.1 double-stranded DNA-binding domain protein [Gregarina niphandrodes]